MNRKSWKYRKRSGANKKKVLKEYLAIANQTINEQESNKHDKNSAVKETESGQALPSTSNVEGSVYLESVDLQYSDSSQKTTSPTLKAQALAKSSLLFLANS